jgi:putative acyl-CoA dehydrogenase
MKIYSPTAELETHEVKNQPAPLDTLPLWTSDLPLQEASERWGKEHQDSLRKWGKVFGDQDVVNYGWQANEHPPKLKAFDRFGHRIDQVDFHPAYHQLMSLGIEAGIPSIAWTSPREGHFAHASLLYMLSQVEPGVCCPLSMSYAGSPVLKSEAKLSSFWEKGLSREYDPRFIPASQKRGLTFGMAMTEKQGGSDVRSNSTKAKSIGEGVYLLRGHKWFCSAPMSDGFLTLAQAPAGLSCFFVPRWTPEGTRNTIRIQRLKDKLGNHANASSEIEYLDTWATLVGEEGSGVKTIIEMVHHTRLDASLANASLMRQAIVQATHHCAGRAAFGRRLIDQPLMRQVLADLYLESEAATWMTLRVAHAFDAQHVAPTEAKRTQEAKFARIATAISKYWVCKRTPAQVYEAMECHGGAGYVEESMMPRLYREAPLNSIWEGSGNVICLDILRALTRDPSTASALIDELEKGRGHHPALDIHLDHVRATLRSRDRSPEEAQAQARTLGADLASALQGSLLAQYAPNVIADSFCETRLTAGYSRVYGDLGGRIDVAPLIDRMSSLIDG